MSTRSKLLALALAALLVPGALALRGDGAGEDEGPSFAPPTGLPSGAVEILAAHPFVLDEPAVHEWRAEKPLYRSGYLLALQVDPDLARPRQTYEAVLYVGEETAERCNAPIEGGRLVVLVPAPLDEHGRVALDLAGTPIWFGSLELPERVDGTRIREELALARSHGIGPAIRGERVRQASTGAAPDDAIRVRTRWDLEPYVEDLVARFSVR
jgi:hypothetical protein